MHSFGGRLNASGIWNGWNLKYGMNLRYVCACLILQYCRIVEERRHCAQVWCYSSLLFPLISDIQWNDIIFAQSEILAINLKGSRIGQPVCWVGCGMDGRIFWFRFSQGAKNSTFLQTFHTSHPPASYSMVRGDYLWRLRAAGVCSWALNSS